MAFLLVPHIVIAAELTARLDRPKVSIDDSFTLIVRSTAMSIFDSPDLTPLERDFEVLGTSRNSQHSIINGKSQSSLEWHISLAAKREGALVIPPIKVDDMETEPLVVEVVKSSFTQQNDGFEPVFMQSEVSADSVYVQAQLILTVRIYYAVALSRGAQLSELDIPNAVVKQINETAYETKVRNMDYNVHEVKYAIFPQRSGTLDIPTQQFSANLANRRRSGSLFDNFGSTSRGRPIRAKSPSHQIDVKPQASEFSGQQWLPAENIAIIETWSKELSELKAGEPITRSLIVEAQGLQGSQIPPLDIASLRDAQQYPDQAETADEDTSLGVVGTRIESQAIIPAGGGELRIPELRLPWWNTRTNRQEVAVVPAQVLTVAGAPLQTTRPATNAAQSQAVGQASGTDGALDLKSTALNEGKGEGVSSLWQYATWLTLALWLATLAYFTLLRRTPAEVTSLGESNSKPSTISLTDLEKVMESNDAQAIKHALIRWARSHTDSSRLSSLSSIAAYFRDDELSTKLKTLDAALYRTDKPQVDGAKILTALKGAIEDKTRQQQTRSYDLQPLYKA